MKLRWTLLLLFSLASYLAFRYVQIPSSLGKTSFSEYEGTYEYAGPGLVAPVSGGCPSIHVRMTVAGRKASIESTLETSVHLGKEGSGDYLTIKEGVEYTGTVSAIGDVSVEGFVGAASHPPKWTWKGSGAFREAIFNGHIENGVIVNGVLSGTLCSYNFELKKNQPAVRVATKSWDGVNILLAINRAEAEITFPKFDRVPHQRRSHTLGAGTQTTVQDGQYFPSSDSDAAEHRLPSPPDATLHKTGSSAVRQLR
jgi:hypothetical protein